MCHECGVSPLVMSCGMRTDQPALSVVVPMYNEAEVLPTLVARLRPVLDGLGEPGTRWSRSTTAAGTPTAAQLIGTGAGLAAVAHRPVAAATRATRPPSGRRPSTDRRGGYVAKHRRRPAGPAGEDPRDAPRLARSRRTSTSCTACARTADAGHKPPSERHREPLLLADATPRRCRRVPERTRATSGC